MNMINIIKIYKRNKETIWDVILIIASFLSIFPNKLYFRCIGLIILVVNFFFFKQKIKGTFIVFSIAVIFIIIGSLPHKEQEKALKELVREGYHENAKGNAKEDLNKLARNIDNYIFKTRHLPENIEIMQKNSMIRDVSYNIQEGSVVNPLFYYEKIDSNYYYISGIGQDGIGGTDDDIIPDSGKLFIDKRKRKR